MSQILAFGLLPSKLNQYQENVSLQCRGNTEAASEVAFRCIYTLFNAALMYVHSVGVLFAFRDILDNIKSHIVETTITILSQTIHLAHPYTV